MLSGKENRCLWKRPFLSILAFSSHTLDPRHETFFDDLSIIWFAYQAEFDQPWSAVRICLM